MNFSEKIKQIRKNFNLTQEELAEKLNVSRQAIAKWECDKGLPDTDNLKLISKLFGISIDSLLDNDSSVPLMVMREDIDIKEFGKWKGEQYFNILNKYFNEEYKIYVLSYDSKVSTPKGLVDLLTWGLSRLEDLSPYYLAVKDDNKYLVNIKNDHIEVMVLNQEIDKEFTIEEKIFRVFGEIKR